MEEGCVFLGLTLRRRRRRRRRRRSNDSVVELLGW
jgi:hypothetical protein